MSSARVKHIFGSVVLYVSSLSACSNDAICLRSHWISAAMGKRGGRPAANVRPTRPKCIDSFFATQPTTEMVLDDEAKQVEEIFAAQLSPSTEAEDHCAETSCSQAAAGRHAVFHQAPGSVAVSEGAPTTPAQSVMQGVEPRDHNELCVEVNYGLLSMDGPGTSEEKVAARAAEMERVGTEVERLYSLAGKCDDKLKAQGSEETEENSTFRALCKAVRDGRFDTRSALAQRFGRQHRANKELGDAYKRCEGTVAKRAFRHKWLEQQYKMESQLRLHTEEYKRADTSKGQYLPFAVLVEREGFTVDPVGAVRAATCIAKRCSELGGNWVQHNPFTDRVEFLRLERQHHEVFTKLWSLSTRSRTDGPPKAVVDPLEQDERYNPSLKVDKSNGDKSGTCEGKSSNGKDAGEEDGHNKDTGNNCKEKNPGKGDDPKKEGKGEGEDRKKKVKRSHVDCLLEKGQKLRGQILTVKSEAAELVAAIKADQPDWHFANNPQNLGQIETLLSNLQLSLTEFGHVFLCTDASEVKKQYAPDVLCVHLTGFLAAAADVKVLKAANSSLQRMQRMQRKRKAPVAGVDQCKQPGATLCLGG